MEIIVSPLAAVQLLVNRHKVGHVVSLLGPETPHRSFTGIADDNHLKLTFHDITAPAEGFTAPAADHVETLIHFLKARQGHDPMLIHCWAGISRSTAAAYIAACALAPDRDEAALALVLREASPSATPNARFVALADDILGRQGRMVDAIRAIGRGAEAMEGTPFMLQLNRS